MKLNVWALAFSMGIIWCCAVFLVGIGNLLWPSYGGAFLAVVASIYPGYHGTASFGQVIVGTMYAFVDATIGGLVFAWLYNVFAAAGRETGSRV
ncbi:MAG: hypothetical protein WAO20_14650 [Acidobacteriota bacterium]|jgi:hypothetical protein